jgi:hypothetical protein
MDEHGRSQPATDDPYTEDDSATTDEWFGQSIERDRELAERLLAEEGGDELAAERRFEQESVGAQEQALRHADVYEPYAPEEDDRRST